LKVGREDRSPTTTRGRSQKHHNRKTLALLGERGKELTRGCIGEEQKHKGAKGTRTTQNQVPINCGASTMTKCEGENRGPEKKESGGREPADTVSQKSSDLNILNRAIGFSRRTRSVPNMITKKKRGRGGKVRVDTGDWPRREIRSKRGDESKRRRGKRIDAGFDKVPYRQKIGKKILKIAGTEGQRKGPPVLGTTYIWEGAKKKVQKEHSTRYRPWRKRNKWLCFGGRGVKKILGPFVAGIGSGAKEGKRKLRGAVEKSWVVRKGKKDKKDLNKGNKGKQVLDMDLVWKKGTLMISCGSREKIWKERWKNCKGVQKKSGIPEP